MENFAVLMLGIMSTGLGVYGLWSRMEKRKRLHIEGSEVIATIVKISGMRRNRKAWISYISGGQEHKVELDYYSERMRVGDQIKILVNNENPQDFMYDSGEGPTCLCIFFIILGITVPIIWYII